MKMRAEINWIIPNIMTTTHDLRNETIVSHKSTQFFDERDDQRQCYLHIESYPHYFPDKYNNLKLYVKLKQPNESSIATKVAVFVRAEKEGQPRQFIFQKITESTEIVRPHGTVAAIFEIGSLEEFKKLSTVSVRCTVEYDKEDLKANESTNNQAASTFIDVDQNSTGLIQQDFEQLFKHQSSTDICFIIGSYRLKAHKLILSARSPVFAAIIKAAEANDNLKDGVLIENMLYINFKDLIHFIYTDQVFLTESNADLLLAAARKYSIPLLINKCEEFLYSKTIITLGNCSEKLIDADVNQSVYLKKMVVDFIRSKPAEVMQTNGWTKLKKSHPNLVIEVMEDILKFRAS